MWKNAFVSLNVFMDMLNMQHTIVNMNYSYSYIILDWFMKCIIHLFLYIKHLKMVLIDSYTMAMCSSSVGVYKYE